MEYIKIKNNVGLLEICEMFIGCSNKCLFDITTLYFGAETLGTLIILNRAHCPKEAK